MHSLTSAGSTSKVFAIGIFVYRFPVTGSVFGFCIFSLSLILIDWALRIYYSILEVLSKSEGGASSSLILSKTEVLLDILNVRR